MSGSIDFGDERGAPEDAGEQRGSLADAIAAHLELKKEHGADPGEVDREMRSALAPAQRDSGAPPPAPAEAQDAPEPGHDAELVDEPPGADPANAALDAVAAPFEAEDAPEPAPPEPAPPEQAPAQEQSTGTFEFEFGASGEEAPTEQAPDESTAAPPAHDPLEDVPDFFQETPEHDKLWFDEAPPRKFDF